MHCWARNLFILVVVSLGTLGMLGACGQKGDLYLPEPEPEEPTPPGADVPLVPGYPTNPGTTGIDQRIDQH
ncbi:LPS translocon maturation chaperone LptM [Thiocystis violacea]|uniref:LPS translocon maturation chaperone LptM n=1 Tax=Thiocystis violacea TaxID=13725 RepID=UPI0019034ED3|nr:lipoprotein [Thiocystis violacea]MBK1720244.1 hypothetical protein [Thiocystis violacea]